MLISYKRFLLFIGLFFLSFLTYAQSDIPRHIVIAPKCLLKNISTDYQTLSSDGKISLIAIHDISQLIAAKVHQTSPCGGFMNVTKTWQEYNAKNLMSKNKAAAFLAKYTSYRKNKLPLNSRTTYKIQYQKEVNILLNQLNPQKMWDNLTQLINIPNRFALKWVPGDNGAKTTEWIKNQIDIMISNSLRNDVSTYTVPTYYVDIITKETVIAPQSSVVLKIGTSSEPGIVIGAHMDDVVWELPVLPNIMPGADDDGAGTVTTLEVARILLNSNMKFKKPIYFIWYAAEEVGLFGSQNVVDDFQKRQIPIEAVMQLDMTGYAPKNDPTIWLIDDDYVDSKLTAYLDTLINEYVKQPVQHTKCGYDCSDHATWTLKGYAAVMPYESKFEDENPVIHSKEDTMDKLSLSHMTDYAKLALAFTIELAEPSTLQISAEQIKRIK